MHWYIAHGKGRLKVLYQCIFNPNKTGLFRVAFSERGEGGGGQIAPL